MGGNLSCFRPSPADDERKFVGLSLMIGNGIGLARSQRILEKFDLALEPKQPDTYLSDCKGIGPKLASVVRETLSLPHEITIRPKVQKARRGRVHK